MARAGYDMWLGSVRGDHYGSVHDTYAYDSAEFWNFTWYEQAIYDLPAQIDRIVEITGKKIDLFGFSQGTTSVVVYNAEKHDHAKENINAAGVMALCSRMAENQTAG